jgi:hypothetical protein
MKTYSLIFRRDWPQIDRIWKRYEASRMYYGDNRWPNLFRTKRNARHLKHQQFLINHLVEVVNAYLRQQGVINVTWKYNARLEAVIYQYKGPRES